MKYICLDNGAVEELVSGRRYQSVDYEDGAGLVEGLSGRTRFVATLGAITFIYDQEGLFLTTSGSWKTKKYLVIDCERSSLFTSNLQSAETLTSFQKLLRFCVKYWSNGVFNRAEKIITGTSKAVIFPLPFEQDYPFRIVIERNPLADRLRKRDLEGRFLLVYKSGREHGNSSTEEADETNIRKVVEKLPGHYSSIGDISKGSIAPAESRQIAATDAGAETHVNETFHRSFDDWMKLLTKQQLRFVLAPADVPHRLFGPAGTGKTLALMLRTVKLLRDAAQKNATCHALLVTHSEATRLSLQDALVAIDTDDFQSRDKGSGTVSLTVSTLAFLCATTLKQSISATEFVDRDAHDSKELQLLYVEEAISRIRSKDYGSFQPHLSKEFDLFFSKQSNAQLAPLFQHEIGVLIKGRAGEKFDKYKACPSLRYGIPTKNEADKGITFAIFKEYQKQLEVANQFDTDDVVISATGQLDTPIWRRRRTRDGFDFIAIDETHLFNINEIHVFHHFCRDASTYPISFTVDEAQAVGDRGWLDVQSFGELFDADRIDEETTAVKAVFRNAPQIREVCASILASGATLFTNFSNTLALSESAFTAADEKRAVTPKYTHCTDDMAMISEAFNMADEIMMATSSKRSQVLITTLSDTIFKELQAYAREHNKPVTVLSQRGDYTQVAQAAKSGHFVVGHADFVGGLEFGAVVIVGVDKGRVPFEGDLPDADTRNYASYAAHNRLYVAASRAQYGLCLLGVQSRGPSDLLKGAAKNGLLAGL